MRTLSETTQRICTAIPLIGITVAAIFYLNDTSFVILDTLLILLIGWEWIRLLGYSLFWCLGYITMLITLAYLTMYLPFQWIIACSVIIAGSLIAKTRHLVSQKKLIRYSTPLLATLGSIYLILSWYTLFFLKKTSTLYLSIGLLNIVLTDIMAYLVGRSLGTHYLPININPNKTWEGCLAGLFGPSILIVLLSKLMHMPFITSPQGILVMLLTSLTAISGDLFESAIKRERRVKDSGNGLPGHGGWLDRCDSLVCAMPVFTVGLICYVF